MHACAGWLGFAVVKDPRRLAPFVSTHLRFACPTLALAPHIPHLQMHPTSVSILAPCSTHETLPLAQRMRRSPPHTRTRARPPARTHARTSLSAGPRPRTCMHVNAVYAVCMKGLSSRLPFCETLAGSSLHKTCLTRPTVSAYRACRGRGRPEAEDMHACKCPRPEAEPAASTHVLSADHPASVSHKDTRSGPLTRILHACMHACGRNACMRQKRDPYLQQRLQLRRQRFQTRGLLVEHAPKVHRQCRKHQQVESVVEGPQGRAVCALQYHAANNSSIRTAFQSTSVRSVRGSFPTAAQ